MFWRFPGYENQDWFIPSPALPVSDKDLALTPDQIRETLNYFREYAWCFINKQCFKVGNAIPQDRDLTLILCRNLDILFFQSKLNWIPSTSAESERAFSAAGFTCSNDQM